MNNRLKILHILDAKNSFTVNFANFISNEFNDNHYFLPIGKGGKKQFADKIKNTICTDFVFDKKKFFYNIFNVLKFVNMINKYDVIIFHSLFIQRFVIVYLILFHKNIIKKSIWMEWGGDLYDVNFKYKIIEKLYWKFVRTLKAIITIYGGDIDTVRNIVKFKGIVYDGCYGPPSSLGFDKLPSINKIKHIKGEDVVVQIGHSTNSSNNHIKILDMFAKYKNQNIKIFLPINYGDMDYSKKVAEHARQLFNKNQLIILEDFVPLDEYLKLLSEVDVCIFDTCRQLGLGNLHYFLGHNIPIYLNKNGVMYKFWTKNRLKIGNIDDIDNIKNVDDLFFECDNQNTDYVKHIYDDKYFYELWKKIFENIEKDFNNAK